MIEDLCEYLERHGYAENVAGEIEETYAERGLKGVLDRSEEALVDVQAWQKEAGEDR